MEGIVLEMETYGSLIASVACFAALVAAAAGIVLGHVSETEKKGGRVYWTAEPVPGTEEGATAYEEEIRLAA